MIAAGQMVVTSAWGGGDSIAFGSCAPRPPFRLPVIEDIDYHGIWAPGCKTRYAQTTARKTCAYTLSGSTCCSATAAAAGIAPAWQILAGYPLVGRAKGGWELVPRQCDRSAGTNWDFMPSTGRSPAISAPQLPRAERSSQCDRLAEGLAALLRS